MEEKLPHIFKDHEITTEEMNKGKGDWIAYVLLLSSVVTDRELVPGGPFLSEREAHKNAIDFLVLNK